MSESAAIWQHHFGDMLYQEAFEVLFHKILLPRFTFHELSLKRVLLLMFDSLDRLKNILSAGEEMEDIIDGVFLKVLDVEQLMQYPGHKLDMERLNREPDQCLFLVHYNVMENTWMDLFGAFFHLSRPQSKEG
jgi:hypothetical protein